MNYFLRKIAEEIMKVKGISPEWLANASERELHRGFFEEFGVEIKETMISIAKEMIKP